jgi:hypothetical protein
MMLKKIGEHIIGNSPKCKACKYYSAKTAEEKNPLDGWCELGAFINGKKINDRGRVSSGDCCRKWKEAKTGLTYYEVMTLRLEEWRTPIERMELERILKEGTG